MTDPKVLALPAISHTVSLRFLLVSFPQQLTTAMIDESTEELKRKLTELRLEHRELDGEVTRLYERAPYDQLQLKRLKKRKLALKDQIAFLESRLLPDIIA